MLVAATIVLAFIAVILLIVHVGMGFKSDLTMTQVNHNKEVLGWTVVFGMLALGAAAWVHVGESAIC